MLAFARLVEKRMVASGRRRRMDRLVDRCLAEAAAVKDPPVCRWPLSRRLTPQDTTMPAELFHLSELVGGYVRLKHSIVTCGGATVSAGSVLPVVACDESRGTVTLQLQTGRPGVQLSGVPRLVFEVVPGLHWRG